MQKVIYCVFWSISGYDQLPIMGHNLETIKSKIEKNGGDVLKVDSGYIV